MAGKGTSIYSYLLIDMMFGRFVLLRVEIKSHKILSTKTAKKRLAKCSPGTRHCEPLFRPALVGKKPHLPQKFSPDQNVSNSTFSYAAAHQDVTP